jgi:hypothetical protein
VIKRLSIVLLFLAGVALAGVGFAAIWTDIGWQGRISEQTWAMAVIDDGNVVAGHAYQTDYSFPTHRKRLSLGWFGLFSFSSGRNTGGWRYMVLVVPAWMIVTALFVCPAAAFYRGPVRRRRRQKRNECTRCGYSLIGNVSGTCPECGGQALTLA